MIQLSKNYYLGRSNCPKNVVWDDSLVTVAFGLGPVLVVVVVGLLSVPQEENSALELRSIS